MIIYGYIHVNLNFSITVILFFNRGRGSTSLESFHLHLARFMPGSSAGAVNFQAYLLDGITRWNSARAAAAVQTGRLSGPSIRSYSLEPSQSPEPDHPREGGLL